ncbi:MAG: acyl carrier protein [Nitrospirota bacterium]
MSAALTAEEVKSAVLRVLGDIAPEADLTSLNPDASFRDQLDLDSMDFLNFVIALHKELNVEIPEADYPKYASLNGCIEQLTARS